MGRARRLTAAALAVCLGLAACDTAVRPAEPSSRQPSSPATGSPYPTMDVLRPDPYAPTLYPRDARAPARLPGTTHDIDLVVDERHNLIAEGLVREVWAYDGTVPGPVIRVGLGDTIRIHLDNHPPRLPGLAALMHPAVNDEPHSVDIPALFAYPDDVTSIAPGAQAVYEFRADRAGVWLYDAATEPTLEHLANGEYGMVIVEPKGGLAPVDQELFLVQGEWYVGPPSQSSPLAKAAAAVPAPDFVVFNGIADQYVQHPIQIATGERVRVFVLDAGPRLATSFRVEGATIDRVVRAGIDQPIDGDAGSRAVELSPGEGAIVELTVAEGGFHAFVGQPAGIGGPSAVGLFQAMAGSPGG